jgi:hypothetical protein
MRNEGSCRSRGSKLFHPLVWGCVLAGVVWVTQEVARADRAESLATALKESIDVWETVDGRLKLMRYNQGKSCVTSPRAADGGEPRRDDHVRAQARRPGVEGRSAPLARRSPRM